MNEKVLKILIFISGFICLVAFISLRSLNLYNSLLVEDVVPHYWDKTKYGELYYFSHIRHFREEGLPPAQQKMEYSEGHPSINDAEIITFGDSFFEFSRHKQFSQRLGEDFGKKAFYINSDFPLQILAENDYNDTTPKLMIFERVERYIPIAFENRPTSEIDKEPEPKGIAKTLKNLKDNIFLDRSELLLDAMLKRSYLTTYVYSIIATIKFDLFGYITDKTPAYKVAGDQSWLFYHDQVNEEKTSFYYDFTNDEIENICDNMEALSDSLKDKYNIHLVYLPLPAKYTLYHNIINNDKYNEFLPRLYHCLDNRDVNFVKVYNEFKNSSDTLYYRTDSHWNQKGIDIAYKKTTNYILNNQDLKDLL